MSPTQRTLARLKELGYECAVVERWNQYAKIRQDLFGFIDILAFRPCSPGVLGIQCTSTTNIQSRITKIKEMEIAQSWMLYRELEVWGWRKYRKAKNGKFWRPTVWHFSPMGSVSKKLEG